MYEINFMLNGWPETSHLEHMSPHNCLHLCTYVKSITYNMQEFYNHCISITDSLCINCLCG